MNSFNEAAASNAAEIARQINTPQVEVAVLQ